MEHQAKQVARVFVLYTGGTIGMAPKDPTQAGSPLVAKPLDKILDYVPGLKADTRFHLSYEGFAEPLDSSNAGPDDWIDMARRIERVYHDYDGFVILHGTDTMAYTASALSFMFENLAKPVVITGSQVPISGMRTDGVMNFVNAVFVAGYRVSGLPCIPEVVIVFADKVLRGCRARKVSTTSWAGFDSPNFPPLGHIGEHIRVTRNLLRPMPGAGQNFQVNTKLNTRVMDIGLTPGFRPSHLSRIFALDDIDAVILRTFGAGNAPDRAGFLEAIEQLDREKKTVLNVTQCLEGTVEMGLYAASSGLLERGVISALDMTPEAALTKLMWTLGNRSGEQIAMQMQVNQRGEQSQDLFDLRYGSTGNERAPAAKFVNQVTPDRRLDVSRLHRSVVRFSGLGVSGAAIGESVSVRVFMNMPSATAETPATHARCVANLSFVWAGQPQNVSRVLDELKTKSLMGDSDITLTVVSEATVAFWFKGLFLAVFANA